MIKKLILFLYNFVVQISSQHIEKEVAMTSFRTYSKLFSLLMYFAMLTSVVVVLGKSSTGDLHSVVLSNMHGEHFRLQNDFMRLSEEKQCSILLNGEVQLIPLEKSFMRDSKHKIVRIFGQDLHPACPRFVDFDKKTKACKKVDWPYEQRRFRKRIKQLQEKFPLQRKALWINVVSAVNSVLVEEPPQPSVLLILHKESPSTSLCIAESIAYQFSDVMNDTSPDPLTIDANIDTTESVKDVYSGIWTHFESRHYSLVVRNFQSIIREFAILFHGLCDNFYAPFKRAVYLLLLDCSGIWDEDLSWEDRPDRIAESVLEKLWQANLKKDTYFSIISRVTNNVVIISPEDDDTLLKSCT